MLQIREAQASIPSHEIEDLLVISQPLQVKVALPFHFIYIIAKFSMIVYRLGNMFTALGVLI
jgi:hypothetical protein